MVKNRPIMQGTWIRELRSHMLPCVPFPEACSLSSLCTESAGHSERSHITVLRSEEDKYIDKHFLKSIVFINRQKKI